MINTYTHRNLRWIDLTSPTNEEVRKVMTEFSLAPLVAEELLLPSLKPKVDLYPNYIYLILHFPAIRHTHGKEANQEVDFIIGRDFIITTRYDSIDPLHKFSKVFEVNSILDREDIGEHAGFIFFYMIKKLYKSLNHELDYLADRLKVIEFKIFSGNEKRMVVELSKVSRELLQFKQSLSLHDEVLGSFEIAARKFFGNDFEYHLKSIIGAYNRVRGAINSNTDIFNELRATNDSILSSKTNEVMKTLTVTAFIILPMTFVSQLFGMSSSYLPLVNSPEGLRLVFIVIALVGVASFVIFKYKKWL
ncbi:MAG: CorA family divalent cation transporter [bacterium]|nr:CorA family divalent cation transporter [bacterium]